MALQIMESHQQRQGACQGASRGGRTFSEVYKDWYFKKNEERFKSSEFAHIASRWISFIGIGGTAQRTMIPLKGGGSQFQDKTGSDIDTTHAAHQIQACIDIHEYENEEGFNEIKNRLGHTDVLPWDLNRRFGTVIDIIQRSVLDENLLDKDKIDFSRGCTTQNKDAVEVIQGKFIKGIEDELTEQRKKLKRLTELNSPDAFDKELLINLLEAAKDIYNSDEIFYKGLEAGIINFYNALTFDEHSAETTTRTVPEGIKLPPNDTDHNLPLSSKKLLGTRGRGIA